MVHLYFRAMQDQFAETKERYRQASGGVQERTKLLAEVKPILVFSNLFLFAANFSCQSDKIFLFQTFLLKI